MCAHSLLFAPDGRRLVAVAASGAVHVIDLESWEVMETLKAHLPKPSPAAAALARAEKVSQKAKAEDDEYESRPVRAADVGGPAVSHARASADGQWLAVVTTSSGRSGRREAGVHVYNLDALKLHASLPPPPGFHAWPPVAAVAFSADGVLALALRDNAIVAYDAESAKVAPWSAAPWSQTALASMPGQICALSFNPTPGSSVLLAQTPAAIARVDLAAKPDAAEKRAGAKRNAPENAEAEHKPSKRRRKSGGGGDGGGDVALRRGASGGNAAGPAAVKMASLDDPCLFLGYFAPSRALMVERPWKEVLKQIPEPLYRHRFGT